jgi:hypothetical protein
MTDISKKYQLRQSCIITVMPRFSFRFVFTFDKSKGYTIVKRNGIKAIMFKHLLSKLYYQFSFS